jgi:hypothetical protein
VVEISDLYSTSMVGFCEGGFVGRPRGLALVVLSAAEVGCGGGKEDGRGGSIVM